MSLDIDLKIEKWTSYDKGETWGSEIVSVYEGNITHNLSLMAATASLYEAIWRPDNTYFKAKDIIGVLEKGIKNLEIDPEYYKEYDAANGRGTYEHFVPFVKEYLAACKKYPDANIWVSR